MVDPPWGHSRCPVLVEKEPAKAPLPLIEFTLRYLFPDGCPDPGKPPVRDQDWWSWAHQYGGIDFGITSVLVTLQALDDTVLVVDPPAVRFDRTEPGPGWLAIPEGVGAGEVLVRRFRVELDGEDQRVQYSDPDADSPRSASFTMSKGDTERLLISVVVSEGLYRWTLELPMVANGRRVARTIDDDGQPFRTVHAEGYEERMGHRGDWYPVWKPGDP